MPERPARIGGRPNLNGIWHALNTAYWNLEDHSAQGLNQFWQLGAIAAIPAGRTVVRGGTIPYTPEALATRNENRAHWPAADPEAKCYMLGVPRVTYHNMPFQIFQADGDDLLMVYPFAATNRVIYMKDQSELPVDSWMGKSMGRWDGDALVVTTKWQNGQSWLDRAGNHASSKLTVTERFTNSSSVSKRRSPNFSGRWKGVLIRWLSGHVPPRSGSPHGVSGGFQLRWF